MYSINELYDVYAKLISVDLDNIANISDLIEKSHRSGRLSVYKELLGIIEDRESKKILFRDYFKELKKDI